MQQEIREKISAQIESDTVQVSVDGNRALIEVVSNHFAGPISPGVWPKAGGFMQ